MIGGEVLFVMKALAHSGITAVWSRMRCSLPAKLPTGSYLSTADRFWKPRHQSSFFTILRIRAPSLSAKIAEPLHQEQP